VYLRGLSRVHTFLLAAFNANKSDLARTLFVGRLDLSDAVELQPLVEAGTIQAPSIVPPWATDTSCLAAYLTWTAFGRRIPIQDLSLSQFRSA